MPPAVPPAQTSRAGLITTTVISVIVAVAMIIVAIYIGQERTKLETAINDLRMRDKPLISENAPSDPRIQALIAAKENPEFQGLPTALDVSLAETDQLAKLVGGGAAPDKVAQQARATLTEAGKRLSALKLAGVTVQPTLTATVNTLVDQITQLAQANQAKDAQLAADQQKIQQTIAAQKDQLDQKDKLIQDANTKAEAAAADAKKFQDEAAQAQEALKGTATSEQKKLQEANAALTTQLQQKDKQVASDQKLLAAFKTKVRQSRVNPNEPTVQHADGVVLRVTDNKTCFINIGQRQSVTKGLTFEVYDKNKGIPPLGSGLAEGNMPAGKASIEVFNVGPDTSECRIVKLEAGQEIVIGDLIANLIYDPNVKYNFVVFGDFDLSNSGAPSPTDAEVVKRLITQWGGKIDNQVGVDTDFVVMGAEPQVPTATDPNDAQQQLRVAQAKKRFDAYQAVIAQASQLGIPIMNQNRFLYFIGYYDQAKR